MAILILTDQEHDPETGLYNYNARLYDPATGMFTTADTIVPNFADPQTLNRYAYVQNNPMLSTDPTGHCDAWVEETYSAPDYDWGDYYDYWEPIPDYGDWLSWPTPATSSTPAPVYSTPVSTTPPAPVLTPSQPSMPTVASVFMGGYQESSSAQLSYAQMTTIIASNNNSGQGDELIMAIAYKESGFNPLSQNSQSSAGGLMGLTDLAIKDLKRMYEGFDNINKYDPAQNIDAASQYLNLRIQWTRGDVATALAGYGTGRSYATSIMNATNALKANPNDPMGTLKKYIGPR